MAFRRKLPTRRNQGPPPPPPALEQIQAEIDELDREERRLNLELLDVLTDVSTPEGSDNDDEPADQARPAVQDAPVPAIPIDPVAEEAIATRTRMLAAQTTPSPASAFIELYTADSYLRKTSKKLMRMKRIVRSGNVEAALRDRRFREELNRIRNLYQDHECRENLFELVAFYCYTDNLMKENDDSTDDEIDDNNDDKLEDDNNEDSDSDDIVQMPETPAILV